MRFRVTKQQTEDKKNDITMVYYNKKSCCINLIIFPIAFWETGDLSKI